MARPIPKQQQKVASFCHIGIDQDGNLVVISSYVKGLVDALKNEIPYPSSRWDPASKSWIVRPEYLERLISLCERFYPSVTILFGGEESDPYETLFLTPSAPFWLVELVYKKLAFVYHPDRGGDYRKMRDLNEAFQEIKAMNNHSKAV